MLSDFTLQTMETNKRPLKPERLTGETGLLTAVIYQAIIDYHRRDFDAYLYFAGDVYREDLELLGLPQNWLPEGVIV